MGLVFWGLGAQGRWLFENLEVTNWLWLFAYCWPKRGTKGGWRRRWEGGNGRGHKLAQLCEHGSFGAALNTGLAIDNFLFTLVIMQPDAISALWWVFLDCVEVVKCLLQSGSLLRLLLETSFNKLDKDFGIDLLDRI